MQGGGYREVVTGRLLPVSARKEKVDVAEIRFVAADV